MADIDSLPPPTNVAGVIQGDNVAEAASRAGALLPASGTVPPPIDSTVLSPDPADAERIRPGMIIPFCIALWILIILAWRMI